MATADAWRTEPRNPDSDSTPGEPAGGTTVVALAESPRSAARRFALRLGDVILTTPAEAEGVVGERRLDLVAIAGDDAVRDGLAWALGRRREHPELAVLVELPEDPHTLQAVQSMIDAFHDSTGAGPSQPEGYVVIPSTGQTTVDLPESAPIWARQRQVARDWVQAVDSQVSAAGSSAPAGAPPRTSPKGRAAAPRNGSRSSLRGAARTLGARVRSGLVPLGAAILLGLAVVIYLGRILGVVGVVLGVLLWLLTVIVVVLALATLSARSDLGLLRREVTAQKRRVAEDLAMMKADLGARRKAVDRLVKRDSPAHDDIVASTARLEARMRATANLFALAAPRGLVPSSWDSETVPEVLVQLVAVLVSRRPAVVLACGSGTATLFLALAVRQHSLPCRIVAVDDDQQCVRQTGELLAEQGVAEVAEVRHAPLTSITAGSSYGASWYDPAALDDIDDLGLVFVRGPGTTAGPRSRYPLVSQLGDRLADECVLVVADVERSDEQAPGATWVDQLTDFDEYPLSIDKSLAAAFVRRHG